MLKNSWKGKKFLTKSSNFEYKMNLKRNKDKEGIIPGDLNIFPPTPIFFPPTYFIPNACKADRIILYDILLFPLPPPSPLSLSFLFFAFNYKLKPAGRYKLFFVPFP